MKKKDSYSKFKAKLSEEEFRRYWGNREESMIAAMNANRKMAELASDPKEKQEFAEASDKLYIECGILGNVFMSLEKFRITSIAGEPQQERERVLGAFSHALQKKTFFNGTTWCVSNSDIDEVFEFLRGHGGGQR